MGVAVKIPRFRGSYVNLDKPRAIKGSTKELYSVMALFEPGADLSAVKAAVSAAMEEKWPGKSTVIAKNPKFKSPFKDQVELVDNEGEQRAGTMAGAVFINLSSGLKPLILGPNAKEPDDPRDIYSGAYYVAKCEVYAWEHEVGGKGVTFSLLGIQKVAEGEKLGGSGARADVSDFEPVEVESASSLFD